MIFTQLS